MRVLVTGSRDWNDEPFIWRVLGDLLASTTNWPLVIVHGGARGADDIADRWVLYAPPEDKSRLAIVISEPHRALWNVHGNRAGLIRNEEMVAEGADLCLAFIQDHSPGATHCAQAARKAGIRTRIYRRDSRGLQLALKLDDPTPCERCGADECDCGSES